jgi:hypothetical protein
MARGPSRTADEGVGTTVLRDLPVAADTGSRGRFSVVIVQISGRQIEG